MLDIAIWVIVLLLGAVVYIVWHGLQITRAQHQSAMASLSSLGGREGLLLKKRRSPILSRPRSPAPRRELILLRGPAVSTDRIEGGMSGAPGAD